MEMKKYSILALTFALTATVAFSSCSSSGVNENGDAPAEDLPVVDAETDQVPPPVDGEAPAVAQDPTSGAIDGTAAQDPTTALPPDAAAPVADASTGAPPSMDPSMPPAAPAATDTPVAGVADASTGAEPHATEYTGPLAAGASTPEPGVDAGAEKHASSGGAEPTGSYTIRKGDTLMKIAYKVYGDIFRWKEILEANRDSISDVKKLRAGATLKVEGDAQEQSFEGYERYAIKSGDTLGTIAHDIYGTKKRWKKLWKMNDKLIKDPNRIYAGFYLRYTFSAEDQQKKEQNLQTEPAPLADGTQQAPAQEMDQRNPSSVAPAQAGGGQPGNNPTITSEPMNSAPPQRR